MTTDAATWVGQTISRGRYQVAAKLGEGGMGVVYRALDRRLDTEVVIKVPRWALLEDPAFGGRFAREIRSLVQLVHPHIVKVMDVGEHDGMPFAVMQYLPGGSLRDRQPVGPSGQAFPLPAEDLRTWLQPVADALDFIHRKNYVHRDIKPDNILFDAEGHAYLSDFGVAKVLAQEGERKKNAALTGTGMILGTSHFMAPELVMGQPVDGRVDQYALGVTVYRLLSGRYPFEGATPAAIFLQSATEEPPPLAGVVATIPHSLACAVQKALAKEPEDRYPDCTSFAGAVLAGLGAAVIPPQARMEGAAATVLCPGCRMPFARPVAADRVQCPSCGKELRVSVQGGRAAPTGRADKPRVGTGAVAASQPPPAMIQGKSRQGGIPKAMTNRYGSAPPPAQLAPAAEKHLRPRVQGRAKRRREARRWWPWLFTAPVGCLLLLGVLLLIAHSSRKQPGGTLEVAGKNDREEPPAAKPARAGKPEERPEEVAKHPPVVQEGPKVADKAREPQERGDRAPPGGQMPVAPKAASEGRVGEIHRFNGGTGNVPRVAFSADGHRALYCGLRLNKYVGDLDNRIIVWDVGTKKELKRIDIPKTRFVNAAFSPDGRSILLAGLGVNAERNQITDSTVHLWDVENGVERRRFAGHDGGVVSVAFSHDGRRAVSGGNDATVRIWDVASGNQVRLLKGHQRSVFALAWSPDGRFIVSGSPLEIDKTYRIWDTETGRELCSLTGELTDAMCVSFAPDGRSILSGDRSFVGRAVPGFLRLWDVKTGRQGDSFQGHIGGVQCVAFSPDGNRALSGGDDQTVRLWDVHARKELHRFIGHKAAVMSVAYSPDARFALSASKDGTIILWRLPE